MDIYADYTKLILLLDGTEGSTTFTDTSGSNLTVTGNGNAHISTAQGLSGGSSLALDGNGDYLTVASSTALGMWNYNFTVEGWFYPTTTQTGNRFLLDFRVATGNSFMLWCSQNSNNHKLGYSTEIGTAFVSGGSLTTNSWNHFAVCRSGDTLYGFVNGVLGFTASETRTMSSPQGVYVGSSVTSSQGAIGYIDNVRVTIGIARYISNFFPIYDYDIEFFTDNYAEIGAINDIEDGGGYQIIGSVTELGVPGPYKVRLFDRRSGRLVRETWSTADGSYVFSSIAYRHNAYFAIAHDHGTNPLNAAIADLITPELMS